MSEIRVNNITNRDGTAGPSIAGIPVVDSNSHFVVPTGRTGQRYADGGENIVRDGLVLYLDAKYSYPGATGTNPDVYTWYDMSGNENNGELKNGVSYSATDGGSLIFDGVDDYVDAGFLNFSTSFTLNCWMKANSGTSSVFGKGVIARYSTQGNHRQYLLGFNESDNYVNFGFSTNGTGPGATGNFVNSPNNSIDRDTWYHIAGVFTSGLKVEIFINGNLSNSVNTSATSHFQSSVKPLEIGAAEASDGITTRVFNGNIAQASIYNRALTASEVLQNYNAHKGRFGL